MKFNQNLLFQNSVCQYIFSFFSSAMYLHSSKNAWCFLRNCALSYATSSLLHWIQIPSEFSIGFIRILCPSQIKFRIHVRRFISSSSLLLLFFFSFSTFLTIVWRNLSKFARLLDFLESFFCFSQLMHIVDKQRFVIILLCAFFTSTANYFINGIPLPFYRLGNIINYPIMPNILCKRFLLHRFLF